MIGKRAIVIWAAVLAALVVPVAVAAVSPLLEWRGPVYIAASFAGVIAMSLLLLQPLLAGGYLPGLPPIRGRRVHAWVGVALVLAVAIHVAGLWLTSPPDVVDALLFRSPTPFSASVWLRPMIPFAWASFVFRPEKFRRPRVDPPFLEYAAAFACVAVTTRQCRACDSRRRAFHVSSI